MNAGGVVHGRLQQGDPLFRGDFPGNPRAGFGAFFRRAPHRSHGAQPGMDPSGQTEDLADRLECADTDQVGGMIQRVPGPDAHARPDGIRDHPEHVGDAAVAVSRRQRLQCGGCQGDRQVEAAVDDPVGDRAGGGQIIFGIEQLQRQRPAAYKPFVGQAGQHPVAAQIHTGPAGNLEDGDARAIAAYPLPIRPVRDEQHPGGRGDETASQRQPSDGIGGGRSLPRVLTRHVRTRTLIQ